MSQDIERKLERHAYEIESLKGSFVRIADSLDKNTESNNKLISTLTIYTTKHDGLEARMKEQQASQATIMKTQAEHGQQIAAMTPTVDALRGLLWKIAATVILSGGGFAAIVAGLKLL